MSKNFKIKLKQTNYFKKKISKNFKIKLKQTNNTS